MDKTPKLAVDAFDWQEIGETEDGGDPKTRLLSSLQIGDCMFHVDAREIEEDESGAQTTKDYSDDYERFCNIADQTDFMTMERDGRHYFVHILPYEA